MNTFLDRIVADKLKENQKLFTPERLKEFRDRIEKQPRPRSLKAALDQAPPPAIIAEIKKASPSKGLLAPDLDPMTLALDYQANGAAALSVLTERNYFLGAPELITELRPHLHMPILRKDFMLDPYQVYEARAHGADVILLIAACLTPAQVKEYAAYAASIGLESILEIHNEEELGHIGEEVSMVGINNRNLKTFEVDINTSLQLRKFIPAGKPVIAESGITNVETIVSLKQAGFLGFLIGENFMKAITAAGIQIYHRSLLTSSNTYERQLTSCSPLS
jgi:indole-3-glycerol phosphate synthase